MLKRIAEWYCIFLLFCYDYLLKVLGSTLFQGGGIFARKYHMESKLAGIVSETYPLSHYPPHPSKKFSWPI